MDQQTAIEHAKRTMAAWNSQDVDAVVACYTDDLVYRDPNTDGEVRGAEAMTRYLGKLFARWQMHWELREAFPLSTEDGAAALWRATLSPAGSDRSVDVEGMDLAIVADGKLSRNEVYFDRAALAPLLAEAQAA